MTQAPEAEAIDLAIVACETCDQLFLESPRRASCPGCGGPAGLRFFQFVGDADGLHLKDGVLPTPSVGAPLAAPLPVAAEPEPAPAGPPLATPEEEEAATPGVSFGHLAGAFIDGAGAWTGNLQDALVLCGVDPEAAATAVGRLTAVRDLIASLSEAGVDAKITVEAEPAAEPAPEPPPEPDAAPQSA